MTKLKKITHLLFLLAVLHGVVNISLPAQTLREYAQNHRNGKMSKDLWERITAAQTVSSQEEFERVILNSAQLAAQPEAAKYIRNLGGLLRHSNRNAGILVVDIPRKNISQLLANTAIEYVSPDRPVQSAGHVETTTGSNAAKNLAGLLTSYDGAGIGIAIIDSGVEKGHELFNKNLVSVTNSLIGSLLGANLQVLKLGNAPTVSVEKSFVYGDASVRDPFGHGTMIASLISGRKGFLSESFTGIAPGANLINLRVLNAQGSGRTSDVIAAIDWCITNKALYNIRVINLSLGAITEDSYTKDPLCLAARRAFDAGIVVIAAAGNYGKDIFGKKVYGGISSPGIEPSVITVGAANTQGTDARSDDVITTFSSRGPTRGFTVDARGNRIYDNIIKPEIVAPGNRIQGAMSLGNPNNTLITQNPALQIYSNSQTLLGTKLVGIMQLSGTSVAAPIVSGTVALMLQANPNLTPSLVKSILMYSAQQLPGFNTLEQGAGELNTHGAVTLAKLVRSDVGILKIGNPMLIGALPASQASFIAGQNSYWSQGILHRYGFFYGPKLMTNWQGMYGKTSLPSDAVNYINGAPILRTDLIMTGIPSNTGIVFADGQIMADGNLIASGIVFADGTSLGAGDQFVDGRIIFNPLRSLLRDIFPLAVTGE